MIHAGKSFLPQCGSTKSTAEKKITDYLLRMIIMAVYPFRKYVDVVRAERKLDLLEKPLIIFQQYQNEGKNPLFMLRYNGRRRHTENIAERDKKEEDAASPGIGTTNGDAGGKPSMMNGMI